MNCVLCVVNLWERRGSPCDLSSGRHAFQILLSQEVLTSRDSADVFGRRPTPGSSSSPQIALALNSEFSIGGGWVSCLSDTSQSFGVLSPCLFSGTYPFPLPLAASPILDSEGSLTLSRKWGAWTSVESLPFDWPGSHRSGLSEQNSILNFRDKLALCGENWASQGGWGSCLRNGLMGHPPGDRDLLPAISSAALWAFPHLPPLLLNLLCW